LTKSGGSRFGAAAAQNGIRRWCENLASAPRSSSRLGLSRSHHFMVNAHCAGECASLHARAPARAQKSGRGQTFFSSSRPFFLCDAVPRCKADLLARPWNIPARQHRRTVRLEVYEKRRRAARRTLMRFGAYPEIVGFAQICSCQPPTLFARRWARPWNIPAGQHLWTVRLEVYEKRRRAARRTLWRSGA
jgi:hypothetical protein